VPVGGLGGDVSKWQASVDWQMAKANGWSFVFIRVLYGMAVDSKFAAHWINSKVAGVLRGAYAYYLDAEDPEAQAQKLFDTLSATGNLGDLPVVADIEEYGNVQITPAKVKKYLEKLTELFGAGNVIVYTGKSVWDKWIGNVPWASAYPLWLAQYTLVGWQTDHLNKVKNYPPTPPKPWVMWDDDAEAPLAGYVAIWQFTASCPAELYGVSGTVVDLDYVSPCVCQKIFRWPAPHRAPAYPWR
jgi:GH25 family lysozyme M1 (1,4-beta-N-acetylmuramidase)